MKKATTIRRIIGITALVLWAVAFVSKVVLGNHNERLVWQLDHWAMVLAPALTAVYAIMWAIHLARGQQWYVKIGYSLACIVVVLLCLITFLFAEVLGDKRYMVYSEYSGAIDPDEYVLYKRKGLLYKRMYHMGSGWRGQLKKAEFTIYKPFDLIKEESDISSFDDDRVLHHDTIFYRLSNGHRYGQDKNDSLLALIK